MYFFKHAHHSTLAEMEHLIGHDIIIKRAFQAIDQASWAKEELNVYDHITKTQLDNWAVEQFKIEQAEKVAEARGREEEKIAMAKEMLLDNEPMGKIIKYTKLSKEQIDTYKVLSFLGYFSEIYYKNMKYF